jgi:hypothetical protein
MKFALFLLGSWMEPEVGAQNRIFDEGVALLNPEILF